MEIRRYIAIAQRWLWLILLGTIFAGATAYIVSLQRPPIYRAAARLLIDQAPGSGGGNEYTQILVEQRLATTYVELIKLHPVMEETVERLDLPYNAGQLSQRLTVAAPPDTQLIVISAEDTSAAGAARIANTIGEVFIDQNQERQSSRYEESIQNWEDRLSELRAEISSLETQINDFGEPQSGEAEAELSMLQTNLREAEIRYTEAFNNLELLRVEEAKGSNNLVMVEPARAPSTPVRPRPLVNGLLAAVAGGLLALGFVLVIEYLDDTVKSQEQIEEGVGLSTLGAIANIRGGEPRERLIAFHTPRDPISEAYRVLRTNLSFAAIDEGLHTMVVTSGSPGEGKSTTVINLAAVTAQTGKSVIVVDSDLRRPMQHKHLDVPNSAGLTTALLDTETPLRAYLQNTKIPNLRVLTSGPIPPNPAELLNSQRMGQIIQQLRDEADTVIFDTPPTLTVADATIMAPQVDGCILVVQAAQTRFPALELAVETLRKANAHVLGIVLNRINVGRSGYYHYRYYNYEYGPEAERRPILRLPNWITGLSKR